MLPHQLFRNKFLNVWSHTQLENQLFWPFATHLRPRKHPKMNYLQYESNGEAIMGHIVPFGDIHDLFRSSVGTFFLKKINKGSRDAYPAEQIF